MTDTSVISLFEKRILNTVESLQRDSKNLATIDDGKRRVDSILESLNNCQDFTTEEVGDSLAAILLLPDVCAAASGSPFAEQSILYREGLAEHLARRGYAELFVKITAALETHIHSDKYQGESYSAYNFYALCNGFMNFSDKSSTLGDNFGKHGGVELLMRIIRNLDSSICQQDEADSTPCQEQLKMLQSTMGILHNCTRHNLSNRQRYRQADVVTFCESKTSSRHLNIRIAAVLLLAQIADEKATERVAPNLDCVLLLVELLRRAALSPQHSINVIGELDGESRYSAQELVNALCRLAINDDNKIAIQTCDGIPILVYMLQTKFSDEESLEAFTLIWHLVFVDSIKRDESIQDVIEIFQILAKSPSYFMREISTYVLWVIRNHEMTLPAAPEDDECEKPPFYLSVPVTDDTKSRNRCILISCQHDFKIRGLFIKDKLSEEGYNVWMNEYPLRERLLAEKISAIEQCVVVLVCVTETYKESPSCRSVTSYAQKLGKPMIPLLMDSEYQLDGWVEKLVGTKPKMHRFCTDDDMDRNIGGLIAELGDRGRAGPVQMIGNRFKSAMKKLRTTLGNNEAINSGKQGESFGTVSKRNPRYWSSQRLQLWLKENGLEKVCLPPELCQGNQLLQLYGHYRKTPEKFTNALKTDLNIDDKTVMKFTASLCRLFN